MVTAVVVAAGKGTRMGAPLPKQVLPLDGRPLLEHSLRAFERHPGVDAMILVLPPRLQALFPLKLGALSKLRATVDGGETRQDSVRNGLDAAADADWIVVHDAARPLVSARIITSVLEAARETGAAVPAVPVGDTLKRVDGDRIDATLDRSALVAAQTPQGFRAALLRRAHEQARSDGFRGTDESQLVERLGEPVRWVEADPLNFKVTTEADLRLAEAVLQAGLVR